MPETLPSMTDTQFSKLLDEMARRFQPVVEEKAHQAIRDLGLTKVDRRHAMYPGVADDADLPARERSYRFFRAVLGNDLLDLKTLSEGTSSSGGYLVPAGFRDEIIARLPATSELAPHVRVVPVRADSGTIPSLATDISITWAAGGTAQEGSFTASDPVMSEIPWSLKRADALTKLSRELVADSQPSVVEFVTRLFQEAIASERDRTIAAGDGSTEPTGLANTVGIPAVTVGGAIGYGKLVEIEQTLPRRYRQRARWIMNGTNLQRIYSLVDATSGRPIFERNVMNGVPESRLFGYPVSQQNDLPDDTIWFGDLSFYLWFDREEMGIESTTVGGDAFANHQVWIKVWERADGKVGLKDAFVTGTGITA